MPPMPSLFIKAVKDICTINTFELLNILFSEVNCLHFGFTTRLFPDTTNDLSIYEVWKLFHRWPLVFGSFFLSPLVARDVVTPPWNTLFSRISLLFPISFIICFAKKLGTRKSLTSVFSRAFGFRLVGDVSHQQRKKSSSRGLVRVFQQKKKCWNTLFPEGVKVLY